MKCKVCGINEADVCIKCKNKNSQNRHMAFKSRVIKRDKKCRDCGETDSRCLSIHHEDKKNHPYDIEYAKLLCFNCHLGRVHNIKRDD